MHTKRDQKDERFPVETRMQREIRDEFLCHRRKHFVRMRKSRSLKVVQEFFFR